MQGTNEPATWRGPKNSPRGGNWKQLSHQTAHPKPHPWPVFLQGRKQGERRENLTVLLAKKPQKPTLNLHTILRHGWEAGLSTVEDNSILVGSLNSWYLPKIQSHKRLCYTRSQASYFFFLPPVPWADMGAFLCMMRPRGKSWEPPTHLKCRGRFFDVQSFSLGPWSLWLLPQAVLYLLLVALWFTLHMHPEPENQRMLVLTQMTDSSNDTVMQPCL